MTKIYSPNERYTGLIAGVSFVNGVAETDDIWLMGWFKEKGYRVEELDIEQDELDFEEEVENLDEDLEIEPIKLEELKLDELKELAKERNVEGYNKMKKDELIQALRGD